MRLVLLACTLFLATASAYARGGSQVVGPVTHVRDGDTIVVSGVPVRLNGLHVPEMRERGGIEARAWMIEHTRSQHIVCRLNGDKTHDRFVGICENSQGDLAAQIIAAGLGRDCPRWSGGRYRLMETRTAAWMPLPSYCLRR